MSDNSDWQKIFQGVGDRVWEATPNKTIKNAKNFRQEIMTVLNTASDKNILKTKMYEFQGLVKLAESEKDGKGVWVILGGGTKDKRNFKKLKDIPHFERVDGCWFDFAIFIDQNPKYAEIIGFDFEIRFPDDYPVKFIRYDLNTPGHDNDMRGMRFHIHPGSDDLMIHSAPMDPLEILHLFLYGLSIPDRPRSS